jgi:hypothetical protein
MSPYARRGRLDRIFYWHGMERNSKVKAESRYGSNLKVQSNDNVGTDDADKDLVVQEIGGRFLEDFVCLRQKQKKLISHGQRHTFFLPTAANYLIGLAFTGKNRPTSSLSS